MCGIAGRIYKRDFVAGPEVRKEELREMLSSVECETGSVDEFLNRTWKYKSNINFLRYFKDEAERKYIDLLCEDINKLTDKWGDKIKLIDRQKYPQLVVEKYREYERLLDVHWFLYHEIKGWYLQIEDLVGRGVSELADSSIVFYKDLVSVINAIDNKLEVRGRDSFGICIQIFLQNFREGIENFVSEDGSELIYFEVCADFQVLSFVFKTANRVGALGENCSKVRELIRRNDLFKKVIRQDRPEWATIVAHTRWASVGAVNISNCHPISNSDGTERLTHPLIWGSMNGDIYNYKEVISKKGISFDLSIDEKYTTDCRALPISLTGIDLGSVDEVKDVFNTYEGSFAVAVQGTDNPGKIILSNSGSQGLYIGFSYDSVMFASDVYGLIETCEYFFPIKSGQILSISYYSPTYNDTLKLEINSLADSPVVFLKTDDLRTTDITTRDINRKNYRHFLEKEIMETKDIVEKTLLKYLQPANLTGSMVFHNAIICSENEVPRHILEKLKSNEIKEIIITGMGTCYTAATAIALYMRKMLRKYLPCILVESHIASEGSGFYLKAEMSDILVIVIAQSGTTVDTNVYVQMAKERGANSIAIANKREGDITFVVDGTLYIGSGRDIEIAVPSTKTYTAQVILGYILTLYLCCKLDQSFEANVALGEEIGSLRNAALIVDETFEYLDRKDVFGKVYEYPLKHSSWYVAYDDSPNSVCGMEIRIKYSEGCYQSLPHLDVDDLLKLEVKNAFITYISSGISEDVEDAIVRLAEGNNRLIVIVPFERLSERLAELNQKGDISFINIPNVEPDFSFIPTAIAGQLASYHAAVALDGRKHYFHDIRESIRIPDKVGKWWKDLSESLKCGEFDQGFSVCQFEHLNNIYADFERTCFKRGCEEELKLVNYLTELYRFSRRPIDTIKHQAKTITVGAVRQMLHTQNDSDYDTLKRE